MNPLRLYACRVLGCARIVQARHAPRCEGDEMRHTGSAMELLPETDPQPSGDRLHAALTLAAVHGVQQLHARSDDDEPLCVHCTILRGGVPTAYPCPTRRAMGET